MASTESTALASYLCSRGGFVHDDLELFGRSSVERERGVFTVGPIRRGELLLRLPRDAIICACENEDTECGWMPIAARTVSPVLRTALYLMRELALGDQGSSWAPYLRMLPCEYDTLEHWTADELETLRGTSVHDELSGLRDVSGSLVGAAEILWKKEIRPLVEAHPALWPDASLGAFLRACAAVRTRGFFDAAATSGAAGPYMLPAIDMLNHSRAGQATSLVVERAKGSAASRSGAGVSDNDVSSGHSAPSSESSGGITRGGNSPLVFSMRAERDLAAGEEVVHTYDDFSDSQLLLTYGFVSSDGEAALPTTAILTLEALLRAAKATAEAATRSLPGPSGGSSSGGGGTGRSLPWNPLEGWFAKEAACARLLAPYGGRLAVSIVEPLPDALLTTMLLLMMPYDDFAELLGDDAGGLNMGGEGGGGRNSVESGQIGVGAPRVPLLDSSVLEDEPLLAAIVVEAMVAVISTAEARYQDETSATRVRGTTSDESEARGTAHIRRLAAARALVQGERAALAATRRAALRLLVEVGLSNDGEDEEGEEDEGEEDEGEEDEGEDDEGEEDEGEEDDDAQPPPPKHQRR